MDRKAWPDPERHQTAALYETSLPDATALFVRHSIPTRHAAPSTKTADRPPENNMKSFRSLMTDWD